MGWYKVFGNCRMWTRPWYFKKSLTYYESMYPPWYPAGTWCQNCYPLDTGLFMLLIPAQHCSLPETIHHKKMNIPHPISLSRTAGPPTLPYRGLYKCLSHPTYSVHCFPHLISSLCDLSIIYSPSCCISVLWVVTGEMWHPRRQASQGWDLPKKISDCWVLSWYSTEDGTRTIFCHWENGNTDLLDLLGPFPHESQDENLQFEIY